MKLNALMFGLACGIVWGIIFLLIALFATFGWSDQTVATCDLIYFGAGTGLAWLWGIISGFLWGLIFGWIGAALYNSFVGTPKA